MLKYKNVNVLIKQNSKSFFHTIQALRKSLCARCDHAYELAHNFLRTGNVSTFQTIESHKHSKLVDILSQFLQMYHSCVFFMKFVMLNMWFIFVASIIVTFIVWC